MEALPLLVVQVLYSSWNGLSRVALLSCIMNALVIGSAAWKRGLQLCFLAAATDEETQELSTSTAAASTTSSAAAAWDAAGEHEHEGDGGGAPYVALATQEKEQPAQ